MYTLRFLNTDLNYMFVTIAVYDDNQITPSYNTIIRVNMDEARTGKGIIIMKGVVL